MNVRKVIIPVAGWGTRSLPASKNIPKEMLPVFDKPVIQYIVEEAMHSGVEDVIFVTNKEKSVIEDHFDYNLQLEAVLERSNKQALLEKVRNVAEMVNVMAVRQKKQLGLGHAVLCAEHLVANMPFAVMVGDDMIFGEDPGVAQLLKVAKKYNKAVVGVMEVPPHTVNKYGIVAGVEIEEGILELSELVEKPAIDKAPSNFAIIGRYVLTPKIFDHLRKVKAGAGGEIQLTDALATLCKEEGMLAVKMQGTRFDAGDWVDYIAANLHFALKEESIQPNLLKRVIDMIEEYKK